MKASPACGDFVKSINHACFNFYRNLGNEVILLINIKFSTCSLKKVSQLAQAGKYNI